MTPNPAFKRDAPIASFFMVSFRGARPLTLRTEKRGIVQKVALKFLSLAALADQMKVLAETTARGRAREESRRA